VEPQLVADKMGAEIIRLWVAATDYSGDLASTTRSSPAWSTLPAHPQHPALPAGQRQRLRPGADTVPPDQLLEIDRYALARAAQLQAEILRHYERYEFHPVVAKLQVFCSEDLGAFYLDVLKDRLYTTAPKSLARRSAQTALWQITQAMLRWMAPFLSFTAEEAWPSAGRPGQRLHETFWTFERSDDAALLAKWDRIKAVRDEVNKALETVRGEGRIGASLQAELRLTVAADEAARRSPRWATT
jgi:isoleucyl-tRNA synthetase